jgi:uncharacterized protein (TIGR00369 family)
MSGGVSPEDLTTRTYHWTPLGGPPPADGLTYLRAVVDGSAAQPPVAATLGFDLRLVEPGRVELGFAPAVFHQNPIGIVLGGVCAAVCDAACGCAVLSVLPAGAQHTTQNLNVSFVREVTVHSGPMTCEASVLRVGRRTALAQASLVDSGGRLHVHATSTFVVIPADGGTSPSKVH